MGEDHRVVVDVDDPGVGSDALGDVVGVVGGGQAGADVEELADAVDRDQLVYRAMNGMDGITSRTRSARSRSAAKLSLPPSQ
jgi:hypothetical protein